MTIVATTIVHPNPGVAWDDVQKQLKRASELARKHGAENVTVLVNMVGDEGTNAIGNAIGFLTTAHDWATYDQIQQSLNTDPDYQKLLTDAGQIAHVIRDRQPSAGVSGFIFGAIDCLGNDNLGASSMSPE